MKLLFFLTIVSLSVGCSKNNNSPKYCWDCTTKVTSIFPMNPESPTHSYTDSKHCDLSETEINTMISQTSYEKTVSQSGLSVKIIVSMTCQIDE